MHGDETTRRSPLPPFRGRRGTIFHLTCLRWRKTQQSALSVVPRTRAHSHSRVDNFSDFGQTDLGYRCPPLSFQGGELLRRQNELHCDVSCGCRVAIIAGSRATTLYEPPAAGPNRAIGDVMHQVSQPHTCLTNRAFPHSLMSSAGVFRPPGARRK